MDKGNADRGAPTMNRRRLLQRAAWAAGAKPYVQGLVKEVTGAAR